MLTSVTICGGIFFTILIFFFNRIQILETRRSEYGYEHNCEKTTFPNGSTKSKWWTNGELIQLPSGWREMTTAASSINSGVITFTKNWYQLNKASPGGNLC